MRKNLIGSECNDFEKQQSHTTYTIVIFSSPFRYTCGPSTEIRRLKLSK